MLGGSWVVRSGPRSRVTYNYHRYWRTSHHELHLEVSLHAVSLRWAGSGVSEDSVSVCG